MFNIPAWDNCFLTHWMRKLLLKKVQHRGFQMFLIKFTFKPVSISF